eukprot:6184539-Pleurochrysis_carterae.AAC.1
MPCASSSVHVGACRLHANLQRKEQEERVEQARARWQARRCRPDRVARSQKCRVLNWSRAAQGKGEGGRTYRNSPGMIVGPPLRRRSLFLSGADVAAGGAAAKIAVCACLTPPTQHTCRYAATAR